MKLFELFQILVEYKREITAQKLGDKLVQAAQRDRRQDLDTILTSLESMDPTKNKQYVEWLCRQYMNGMFRLEDKPTVVDALTKFEKIKPRLPQRDINRYTFNTLSDEMDKQYNVELKSDDNDHVEDAKILYKGPLGQLSIPLTKEASCILGSGTKWCTTYTDDDENMFSAYSEEGPLYIWKDKDGSKYQFHFASNEYMDARNRPIPQDVFVYFRTKHPVLSKLFAKEEREIAKDAGKSYDYAFHVLGDRFPAGEYAIAVNHYYSNYYKHNMLKDGRFPVLEDILLERGNVTDLINYVDTTKVDQKRIPEIEKFIFKNGTPVQIASYAVILRQSMPEVEDIIASDPAASFQYIDLVSKENRPLIIKAISKVPYYAFKFAHDIENGPFPEGEAAIATDPYQSIKYATYCLGDRFPAGEPVMKTVPSLWKQYEEMARKWDTPRRR